MRRRCLTVKPFFIVSARDRRGIKEKITELERRALGPPYTKGGTVVFHLKLLGTLK